MIIDGRSCASVVSLSMIEKLGFKVTTHPHPYNIQCLNQYRGLQLSSQCLMSSIKKNYQDELCYDVIPMDAYHTLLGRS